MTSAPDYTGPVGPVVGVLGGMGPLATADFLDKLTRRTPVRVEADHLPTVIWSNPQIPDRTGWLLGQGASPVPALIDGVRRLSRLGATLIAIPCNTAHAFLDDLRGHTDAQFVDMMSATAAAARSRYPDLERIGILSTAGTRRVRLYETACERVGMRTVDVGEVVQAELVDPAINEIKALGDLNRAKWLLGRAVEELAAAGAQAVVAGCTELPVVMRTTVGLPVVDATDCLAAAVVEAAGAARISAAIRERRR